MSLAGKNRFALLCDDELDPEDIVEQANRLRSLNIGTSTDDPKHNQRGKGKKAASLKDNQKLSATEHQDHGEKVAHVRQDNDGKAKENSGSKSIPSGAAGPETVTQGGSSPPWIASGKPKDQQRSLRGRGAVTRKGAIPKHGGYDTRGKREFDRQSGSPKSGVKAVEKRDGGGARNWGRPNDDLEVSREELASEEISPDMAENPEIKPGYEQHGKSETAAVQMTLEEWKHRETQARSAPLYKLRKAGEGGDNTQWENTRILKKKSDDIVSSEEDSAQAPKGARKKQVKSVEVFFGEKRAVNTRGRGGRRGGKKEPTTQLSSEVVKFGSQSSVPQENTPNLDDLLDFPSLGGC